jgi:hypothetical protein
MIKLRTLLLAIAVLFLLPAPVASADPPPGPYFNGFETDTAGWFDFSGGTITRVASGSTSTYASGVSAATGNFSARLGKDPSPDSCTFGGGTAQIYSGPFTRWGGYSSVFPPNGYTTRVDIYLDVTYATSHLDTRFDWSSAINNPSGGFRRDFVFNVGTDAMGFVITGGNNATRCGANPYSTDPNHAPQVHIMQSGWYTFQHAFKSVGGQLTVVMSLIRKSDNVVMGTWTRSDPSDVIGMTVGGNRYGWFVQNEFDGLAIDNSERTGLTLMLTPKTATNPAGTQHCVTATVSDTQGPPPPSGVTVRFSVTGANSASGSAQTTAIGEAQFCYTGTNLGSDTITAYADVNNNTVQDSGEPADTATKTWTVGPPARLTLNPRTATNPVGTQHCVTATVTDQFENPTPWIIVRFSVTGSVNTTGSATTNTSGQATFCYNGPPFPGADAIHAYADTNNSNTQDLGEPFDDATKTWVLPVSTPGCEVKITNGGWIIAANGDKSSFGGNAMVDLDGNVSGNEEYQDHGPAQPMNLNGNVLVVVCTSTTQATIYGQATIDGSGSFFYRLNVEDNAEPGKGADKYWMFVDNGYDSGNQTLMGGNVQIHKS